MFGLQNPLTKFKPKIRSVRPDIRDIWPDMDFFRDFMMSNDRRVLDRFRKAVGTGNINGPYGRARMFYFKATGPKGNAVLTKIWPYLSPLKRAQARRAGYVQLP